MTQFLWLQATNVTLSFVRSLVHWAICSKNNFTEPNVSIASLLFLSVKIVKKNWIVRKNLFFVPTQALQKLFFFYTKKESNETRKKSVNIKKLTIRNCSHFWRHIDFGFFLTIFFITAFRVLVIQLQVEYPHSSCQ